MPPYNVEDFMPPRNYTPEQRRAIMSVNLMCFLLDNISYIRLYNTTFEPVLKDIIEQAKRIDDLENASLLDRGAYNSIVRIRPMLVKKNQGDPDGALDKILAIVAGSTMKLGSLFTDTLAPDSVEQRVVDEIIDMYRSADVTQQRQCELEHFCCPFMYFQETGNPRLPVDDLNAFLLGVGDKSMLQFYKENKKTYIAEGRTAAIVKAREDKILVDHSSRLIANTPIEDTKNQSGTIVALTYPPSNGLRCDGNGTCVQGSNNDWCNTAGSGCSAAST